jgi:hypothetical protein
MKKKQILMIHGGMTFKNQKDYLRYLQNKEVSTVSAPYWEADLGNKLGDTFQIIRPRMPLSDNAKYRDWKILFEKYIPLLTKDYLLIGSSLGGIFLAKYLSENVMPQKALSVYIVCAPFDGDLPKEDLVGGFKLTSNLSRIEENCKNLYLMFSSDDDVVPVSHAEKYREKLPEAQILIYKDRKGHFKTPTFPAIIKLIKKDVKRD